MRKIFIVAAVAFAFSCLMPAPAARAVEGEGTGSVPAPAPLMAPGMGMGMHRIGIGVNYWKTIDNVGQKFDSHGLSYLASYQYAPVWFFKIETDLEIYPDPANTSKPVLAPEVYATVGGLVYGGVGIGYYYHDGDWGSAPFYMLRVGLDFPVLPRLFLDINANYRFNDWNSISWNNEGNPGTDTIRLGAALRFVL